MELSGQLNAPAALPPRKEPPVPWIGGWVDVMEKRETLHLPGIKASIPALAVFYYCFP
jgi:hypothetical protein